MQSPQVTLRSQSLTTIPSAESVSSRTTLEVPQNSRSCDLPQEPVPEDHSTMMPDRASLYVVYYMCVLLVTNIVVVVPTADHYAERLGASEAFSGLMIGLTPAFAGLGILLNQCMLRHMTMKSVMITMVLGSVCGNCIYALGGLTRSPWTLLAARAIIGLCAGNSLPPLYTATAVGIKKRTQVGFCMQVMANIGYVMGPLFAWALEVFVKELRIENLVLDSDTMPGWCMACLYFFLIPKVLFFFKNPSGQLMQAQPQQQESPAVGSRLMPLVGVLICIWAMFALTISTAVGEVFASRHASQHWGWNVQHTSLFLVGVMAFVGPMTISAGRIVHAVEDRKGLLVTCSLAIPLCVMLIDFNMASPVADISIFTAGLIAIFAASSIARAFIGAMATKIVPPHLKSSITSITLLALCAGRGAGSFLGPLLDATPFALLQMGIFVSTAVFTFLGADSLKAHAKAC